MTSEVSILDVDYYNARVSFFQLCPILIKLTYQYCSSNRS